MIKVNGVAKRRLSIAETNALLRKQGQEPVQVKALTQAQRNLSKKNTLR